MIRSTVLGLATALALTGPGALSPASARVADPVVVPPDPFFAYDRPATHEVVETPVTVPTRDGSHLACRLYRPGTTTGDPAPGRFPGIVYEYTAYADQADAFGEGASWFVERGYDAIVCQVRGSGASPGTVDPFGPQEQRDNHDLIEWLADQPHSTGRIGQMGVSYGGHTSLLAAVNQPPSLRAVIPTNGISDWYENTIYRGGIYSPRIRPWQEATAPGTLRSYAEHPAYDDFWRDRSVQARWDRLRVPTLEINGWYDRYRDGMVENLQARPRNVWLVSGPWEHGSPAGQHAGLGNGPSLAWWDHWLRGDRSAPLPQARVTSYEVPGPGAGRGWQQFDSWPPRESRRVELALTRGGGLDARWSGRSGERTFVVNTETTEPSPEEQLRFSTPALRRDVVLAGDGELVARARFTATDGNLAAVLYDQAPDGTLTRVTNGWLKASHRHGHTRPRPVRPGRPVTLELDLWPTHHRLVAGHRLVLRLSSDDHPEIDSDAPAGTVVIAVGRGGTTLGFDVLPAG